MMHSLGFVHEHQRIDSKDHHKGADTKGKIERDPDFISDEYFISIGHYDYQSIMHYKCHFFNGLYNDDDTKQEMEKWVNKSETFSKGDIAAIKILYGLKDSHYGEWHPPCTSANCSDMICYCDSCGNSKPWCGFHGKRNEYGHWTCCMNENKGSTICHSKGHTGFWHMKCESNCPEKGCKCGACGAGCKYIGKKAHWSCCLKEKFDEWCTNLLKQK